MQAIVQSYIDKFGLHLSSVDKMASPDLIDYKCRELDIIFTYVDKKHVKNISSQRPYSENTERVCNFIKAEYGIDFFPVKVEFKNGNNYRFHLFKQTEEYILGLWCYIR